jgi:Cu(I)/Ag(I) efflux system membrane fusion protein
MKKFLYALFLIILLGASFWVGAWYNNRKSLTVDPLATKSSVVKERETGIVSKVPTDAATDDFLSSLPGAMVKISPEKQQMIGVRIGLAEKSVVTRTLRLLGRVAPDENRVFKIKAAVDGIVQEVYPSTTGSMVKKGQPLASYYSPDIYAAVQGYLIALSSDRYRSNLQVQVTESRLQFLGMSASQIEELKKTGKIEEIILLRAPATGFVLSREVSPQFRFQKGEELYRIAELDRVWIFADIYENEARYVRPGATAKVSHPELGKELQAKVSDALPLFDTATRTLKVRLEVDNPGFLLRPDMFVDVELPISLPPAITVPADAVFDSGLKKTVFVDHGDGLFEPRQVETGWHFANRIEIKKGLKPGERIVMSATFLIDSESRLELVASGMYGTLSKDPVCGADVSINKAEKAGRKTIYKNKAYYFSSEECKVQFEKNPDRYAEKP